MQYREFLKALEATPPPYTTKYGIKCHCYLQFLNQLTKLDQKYYKKINDFKFKLSTGERLTYVPEREEIIISGPSSAVPNFKELLYKFLEDVDIYPLCQYLVFYTRLKQRVLEAIKKDKHKWNNSPFT